MIKKLIIVFLLALVFNLIWEHLHANLYVHYQGGAITDFILFRSAIFDALIITLIGWLTIRYNIYLPIIVLVLLAIALEKYALTTGRWNYNELMPIIPIIQTGLTPTIQLGVLAFLSFWLAGLNR